MEVVGTRLVSGEIYLVRIVHRRCCALHIASYPETHIVRQSYNHCAKVNYWVKVVTTQFLCCELSFP